MASPSISFEVLGAPKGKARARSGKNGFYTPDSTVAYEEAVAWKAKEAMAGKDLFEGPVCVRIWARFSKPKSWSKKKRAATVYHTSKPDADNIAKIICDGMNGVVYRDDAQAVEVTVYKRYADDDPSVGVEVHCMATAARMFEVMAEGSNA